MAKEICFSVRSLSETPPDIREILMNNPNVIHEKDGYIYLYVGDRIYSCEKSPEGKTLLTQIISPHTRGSFPDEESCVLRDVLNGKKDISELKETGLTEHAKRCVILLRLSHNADCETLQGLIPFEESDRITVLDNGDAVLLIQMDEKTQEEVLEFASATIETLESEAGITCFAGIGRPVDSLERIITSYRDAATALSTAIRHRIPGFVFVYGKHILEQFADLIPAEKAEKIKKDIITDKSEKVLTAETIETVRAFFLNDLNLSTTARQLYIHRNTLIYRLEKIRKATGLDLKKFEDAAVFRMLMSIQERQT